MVFDGPGGAGLLGDFVEGDDFDGTLVNTKGDSWIKIEFLQEAQNGLWGMEIEVPLDFGSEEGVAKWGSQSDAEFGFVCSGLADL